MGERPKSSRMLWLTAAGGIAVCCGLPVGLAIAAIGSTAAIVTGALWVALGGASITAMLVGIHLARRRAAANRTVFVPLEDFASRSELDRKPAERKE